MSAHILISLSYSSVSISIALYFSLDTSKINSFISKSFGKYRRNFPTNFRVNFGWGENWLIANSQRRERNNNTPIIAIEVIPLPPEPFLFKTLFKSSFLFVIELIQEPTCINIFDDEPISPESFSTSTLRAFKSVFADFAKVIGSLFSSIGNWTISPVFGFIKLRALRVSSQGIISSLLESENLFNFSRANSFSFDFKYSNLFCLISFERFKVSNAANSSKLLALYPAPLRILFIFVLFDSNFFNASFFFSSADFIRLPSSSKSSEYSAFKIGEISAIKSSIWFTALSAYSLASFSEVSVICWA